ncbi:hypothetical protein JTB14_022602 [Gonioctena quinquepunctata]|nr:hypothetical protein JTB14_022602 [Gonioctena quinquepunctata]
MAWDSSKSVGWYQNVPIGKKNISKWIAVSAQEIGIDIKTRKITNISSICSDIYLANVARRALNNEKFRTPEREFHLALSTAKQWALEKPHESTAV